MHIADRKDKPMTALARPLAAPDTLRRRAMQALTEAVARALDSASEETLAAIVGAQDAREALAIAPRDLAPPPPERLAAERAARARTAAFRAELAERAGGMYDRAELAELLGVTPAAIDKQRQRRQILGVPFGTEIRYPAAQFRDGAAVPGLKAVLDALGDMHPWGQLQLLVAPLDGFGDAPAPLLDLLATARDAAARARLAALAAGWAA
ncbi:hypothetical protein NS334_01885 [Sphingomonas endophytica]|uniref:DNA-binding protein n=2 Tax=Sphingomonas endophytica TaxID=869719 RepID=A0A147I996_9SPHN|nr:hypothetical protein NS334_01885 [Sphingomonas endophytica]